MAYTSRYGSFLKNKHAADHEIESEISTVLIGVHSKRVRSLRVVRSKARMECANMAMQPRFRLCVDYVLIWVQS